MIWDHSHRYSQPLSILDRQIFNISKAWSPITNCSATVSCRTLGNVNLIDTSIPLTANKVWKHWWDHRWLTFPFKHSEVLWCSGSLLQCSVTIFLPEFDNLRHFAQRTTKVSNFELRIDRVSTWYNFWVSKVRCHSKFVHRF